MLYKKCFCFILCAIIAETILADEVPASNTNVVDEIIKADSAFVAGEVPDTVSRGFKRTIDHRGTQKFNSPIIVEEHLFSPSESSPRKQINVQIIEPESHNNGQFLKETTFVKEENNTVVSSTTTSTTTTNVNLGGGQSTTLRALPAKFLTQVQPLRLSKVAKLELGDDCDEPSTAAPLTPVVTIAPIVTPTPLVESEHRTVVNVHKNVRVNKVVHQPALYGSRKLVGPPTKKPCGQTSNCEDNKQYLPPPINTIKTEVVQQPIYIHTHTEVPVTKIVDRPVPYPVEKLVEKVVKVPYAVDRIVNRPYPVEKIVQKPVPYPVEKIVDRPYEVEKLVVKEVKVPVDRIVEKIVNQPIHIPVDRPVPYPVEKVVQNVVHVPYEVEKIVDRPVEVEKIVEKQIPIPFERIIEKIVDRPIEIERIVEKEVQVPVDRVVETFVDRPVAVPVEKIVEKPVPYAVEKVVEKFIDRPVPVEIGVPVHVPYLVHVEVPVYYEKNVPYPVQVHVPYLIKSPPKSHYYIKTNKGKDHGLFDFKHNAHKTIKHVFLKPNLVPDERNRHPYPFETIGLLPPPVSYQSLDSIPSHIEREPRFQSLDGFGSASVNHINTLLPNSYNSYHSPYFYPHKGHVSHHFSRPNYSGGLNVKELRWEYGFKPPLIPSTEIDDFGNPIKRNVT